MVTSRKIEKKFCYSSSVVLRNFKKGSVRKQLDLDNLNIGSKYLPFHPKAVARLICSVRTWGKINLQRRKPLRGGGRLRVRPYTEFSGFFVIFV